MTEALSIEFEDLSSSIWGSLEDEKEKKKKKEKEKEEKEEEKKEKKKKKKKKRKKKKKKKNWPKKTAETTNMGQIADKEVK